MYWRGVVFGNYKPKWPGYILIAFPDKTMIRPGEWLEQMIVNILPYKVAEAYITAGRLVPAPCRPVDVGES